LSPAKKKSDDVSGKITRDVSPIKTTDLKIAGAAK
jgi:hypothetical protein